MSYCPECGEQVANHDVFCPFCGISLKPIVPVDDASMSETIVGMPPVALDQDNLMASPTAAGANYPKAETQSESVAAQEKTDAPIEIQENSVKPVAGDTSENWSMMTESVEIPADQLPEASSVPLPAPSLADERQQEKTEDSRFDSEKSEETLPPLPEAIDPADLWAMGEDLPNSEPLPTIEQENAAPKISEPLSSEPISEQVSKDKTEEQKEKSVSYEIPSDFSDFSLSENQSPASMNLDNPGLESVVSSDKNEESTSESSKENSVAPENSESNIVEPINEAQEAPIAMPEMPLALESQTQEDAPRYDSVQIIQKNEIKENLDATLLDAESRKIKSPIVQNEDAANDAKEGRSFTTPNIGNTDTDGRKAAKLKPLDEGTILNNRYEIVRKIGGGGMGAVYLANDRNLGGVLRAVKEMVQSYIESEQQDKAVNDFKRESLLLTSLDHPAIPTIYDYFFDEKEARFYLVMKYISGGDLASRLRAAPEGRIDEKSVVEWAIQIADVLDYLHNHEPSIVYRDLKPANVMIDGNSGRVMLIDFGIARWVNKEEKGVTAVGTMGYAPPELFSGNVEPRSDIYSLGSTMFHLLTGADPQSNPLLIFDFQKNPRPRQINSQLSDQIEQILMRSVEYNAEARFRSAAELRDALKEHFNNLQMGKVTYGIKVAPSNRAFSEQAVFCGFCGKQIVATDVFCAFCGAQQPIAQQHSAPSIAVHPMTAKLVIHGTGELEPSSFRLEKSENLLGRRDPMSNIFPEVDLSKYDPQTKISRRHARIWREGNSFLVEDLGSSNGTTLLPSMSDSVRLLPHQPHTLTNGDKIRVGDTTLHFTIG